MFQAMHAARYQRQEAIRSIEQRIGTRLISYVSGLAARIQRDDVLGMADILHNVPRDSDLDFMLHTGGGDLDAAEKLL